MKNLNYINYSEQIKAFYKNFNINIEISKIIDSYSITRYFIKLDRTNKTKIANVEKLVDDLSVELNVKNVKFNIDFETGSIVLEVPKKERTILYYKDIQSPTVNNNNSLLVCLGKDLNNNNFIVDLCQTPHLLIAGTTGSGKSMFINSILCNLINTYNENILELSLIDPKKVELSMYKNVVNVKDVATDLYSAKELLKDTLKEISYRYELLEQTNVRNISNYNKKVANKLPYKLVVVDELADIIIQDRKKKNENEMSLEDLIVRIAQIGRACGVHLIVATQRPSADVITGLIKANIPSRVAFSVSSKIDSRIILDEKGAEKLTGKGDMLVKIVGDDELHRLQGAYISDEEVEKIVKQHQRIGEVTPVFNELNKDIQKQHSSEQLQNTFNVKIEQSKQEQLKMEEKENKKSMFIVIFVIILTIVLAFLAISNFWAFAIVCVVVTIITSIINAIYVYFKKNLEK